MVDLRAVFSRRFALLSFPIAIATAACGGGDSGSSTDGENGGIEVADGGSGGSAGEATNGGGGGSTSHGGQAIAHAGAGGSVGSSGHAGAQATGGKSGVGGAAGGPSSGGHGGAGPTKGTAGESSAGTTGESGGHDGSAGGSPSGSSGSGGTGDSNGGSPSSTGGSASGGSPIGTMVVTDYAPYFYTWGWGDSSDYAFGTLVDLRAQSSISGVTLAFVLSNNGCVSTTDIQDNISDVNAFRAAGGKVKASFGGANGTYLENACGSADDMAKAIEDFIDATQITDLDFDVEQSAAMTDDVNSLRAKALKKVQDDKGAKIAFTLAAVPTDSNGLAGGLSSDSLGVVTSALSAGLTISHVNLMTMDYGGWYSDGKKMGDLAVSCLTDTNAQLRTAISGLSEADAYGMLGATPMIGQNDVGSEIFGIDDAKILANFASEKGIGLIAFWAIQRDVPGTGDLGLYSQVDDTKFAFNAIFQPLASP